MATKSVSTIIYFGFVALITETCVRNAIGYKFSQSLIDWRFGITRRGLFGEVLRHIVPPPYDYLLYLHISEVVLILVALSLCIFIAVTEFKNLKENRWFFMLLFLGSPLALKNIVFDIGRTDIYGIFVFLLAAIMYVIEYDRILLCFSVPCIAALSLLSENTIFLFGPSFLYICYCSGQRQNKAVVWTLVPAATLLFALVFNQLLPPPHVSIEEYHAYLQSKSLTPMNSDPEVFLYMNGFGALSHTFKEVYRQISLSNAKSFILMVFFIIILTWSYVFYIIAKAKMTSVEKAMFYLIPLCYVPLYCLGTDWFRWTSNLTFLMMIIILAKASSWNISLAFPQRRFAEIWLLAAIFVIPIGISEQLGPPTSMEFIVRMDPGVRPKYDPADLIWTIFHR
ncbi:hypothetical protein CCR94_07720 [Rhodoblastus sphagnicola]|uniref:Uncharacterized protein n=1 Tax=Rhodoblastus sphagnicola TaxID=333368 RepID=A0A2S6NBE1_9HYPH|nr:hypothetical protein CCR94_07720 [Rhodoblastus sphagnicola]